MHGFHPVETQGGKAHIQHGLKGFGHQSLPPQPPGKAVAYFGGLIFWAVPHKADGAHQVPGFLQHNAVAGGRTVPVLLVHKAQVSPGIRQRAVRLPQHVPGYLRVTGVGEHIRCIAHPHGAENQPLGGQNRQMGKHLAGIRRMLGKGANDFAEETALLTHDGVRRQTSLPQPFNQFQKRILQNGNKKAVSFVRWMKAPSSGPSLGCPPRFYHRGIRPGVPSAGLRSRAYVGQQ